uniref:BAHD acyltransferase At5g47980-like n=1 Tax=Rhizophora mucronata TaxID=61149 RepID=A0A2P2LNW4_RHIMU
MEITVQIVAKQTVKPSSPTPDHLRNFKLCLLDQLSPAAHGSVILFYLTIGNRSTYDYKFQQLKGSLADTLTRFYPLAGRIREDSSIECNDHGVVFAQAKVNCFLSDCLESPDAKLLSKLIPGEFDNGSVLAVQSTCFDCGGLAIGVCISYKIGDGSTLSTFIQSWAAAALVGSAEAAVPLLNAASIFPPQNLPLPTPPPAESRTDMSVTRRFVFDGSKIAALKAKSTSETVTNPTRVEAVTALIWKCAMNASRSNSDHISLSILSQSGDIRKKMVPPLPGHTIGHLVGYFASLATESEMELKSLVAQLRKGEQDFGENYVEKLQGDQETFLAISKSIQEAGLLLQRGATDFYISISLCRFPFYGVDFGWGRPSWVTVPSGAYTNVFAMIETRNGDGIEAWVTLTEDDMAFFERDQDLLAVASSNPSACNCPIMPQSSL